MKFPFSYLTVVLYGFLLSCSGPTVLFEVYPENPVVGQPITVYNIGDNTRVSWDFGEGTSASGYKASHTYRIAGQYTITCTVKKGHASYSAQKTVEIAPYSAQDSWLKSGEPSTIESQD